LALNSRGFSDDGDGDDDDDDAVDDAIDLRRDASDIGTRVDARDMASCEVVSKT